MDQEEVLARIRGYVLENFYYGKPDSVADDTDLMEAGAVDSTGFMELVAFVEEGFRVAVADEDLVPENFASIGRMAAFVARKRSPQEAGRP